MLNFIYNSPTFTYLEASEIFDIDIDSVIFVGHFYDPFTPTLNKAQKIKFGKLCACGDYHADDFNPVEHKHIFYMSDCEWVAGCLYNLINYSAERGIKNLCDHKKEKDDFLKRIKNFNNMVCGTFDSQINGAINSKGEKREAGECRKLLTESGVYVPDYWDFRMNGFKTISVFKDKIEL